MLIRPRAPRLPAGLLALLLLWGCSDGDDGDAEGDDRAGEPLEIGERPEVAEPDGPPPDTLTVEDLVEGEGDPALVGAVLTVHYVGLTWGGSEFASSWERGQPLIYEHGQGRWVEGWQHGIEGMREGGRRRIVVPPELGYGDRGAPGVSADETLVFVVDLLDVG